MKDMKEGIEIPTQITDRPWPFAIELTNKCPFKCIMCPRTKSMTRDIGFMSFDLFKNIITQFSASNWKSKRYKSIINLHDFGESLVHPEFEDFISFSRQEGFRPQLSINPLMLTPSVRERLLNSGISKLICSLDGHDDKSFEEVRGVPNAWQKSFNQFEAFLEEKEKLNVQIDIELSMINFKKNRGSIENLRKYWESHPRLEKFLCKNFITWDGSDDDVNDLIDTLSEEILEARPACKAPWNSVVVLWDGRVVPCCYDYNGKYVLGDFKTQSLEEIWNGFSMQKLRKEFLSESVTNTLCKDCHKCPGVDNPVRFPSGRLKRMLIREEEYA